MGTISMSRKSRHDELRKEAVGSEALNGGSGWSKVDIVSVVVVVYAVVGDKSRRRGGRSGRRRIECGMRAWRGEESTRVRGKQWEL